MVDSVAILDGNGNTKYMRASGVGTLLDQYVQHGFIPDDSRTTETID